MEQINVDILEINLERVYACIYMTSVLLDSGIDFGEG